VLLVNSAVSRNVANSVFVDDVFGNDATGMINNFEKPFQTIAAGIAAAATQNPNPGNVWHVYLAPGFYFENPIIPDSVYVTGSGPDTFIFGTVTHTGGTLVTSVLIISTDAPAIIVNSTEDVNYLTSVLSTTFQTPQTHPIATVKVLQGEFGFTSGAMFSTYGASAPKAFMIDSSNAGLVLQDTEVRLTVSGVIPKVIFYSVGGTDKMQIAAGVSSCTLTQAVNQFIFFDDNGLNNCTVTGNRIELLGNNLNTAATFDIARLTGGAELQILAAAVRAEGLGDSPLRLAEGIASGGVSPSFGIAGSSFIDTLVPPVVGSFDKVRVEAQDVYGSLKLNGGLYANINSVSGDYTVAFNDYTVLETAAASTVTLPSYNGSKGRIVYISNTSSGSITVAGNIRGASTITLPAGLAGMFQNDGNKWNYINF